MSDPRLPAPLLPLVDDRPPARSHEMWRAIQDARKVQKPARRPSWTHWSVAAACVLACVLTLQHGSRSAPGPLTLASMHALPLYIEPGASAEAFQLSDGSHLSVGRGARLDVLETSGRRVSLALRLGRVHFDVRPHGPRAWRIDCGAVTVEVVGTSFTIDRSESAVKVSVTRGAVLVRGSGVPDGAQRLNAGQQLEAGVTPVATHSADPAVAVRSVPVITRPGAIEDAGVPDESPVPAAESVPASSEGALPVPTQRARYGSEPRRERSSGSRRPAVGGPEAQLPGQLVGPGSNEDTAPAQPGADDTRAHARSTPEARARSQRPARPRAPESELAALWHTADAARKRNAPAEAVASLTLLSEIETDRARAAFASFTLAELRLSQLDQPKLAAADLERALERGLREPLAEEASARLVEAYARAGNVDAACRHARFYEARYRHGHYRGTLVGFCPSLAP